MSEADQHGAQPPAKASQASRIPRAAQQAAPTPEQAPSAPAKDSATQPRPVKTVPASMPTSASKPAGGRSGWLSKAAAKLPFKWVTTAIVGLFLAATAAFGGLEPVAATPPTQLAAGETHEGTMVTLTPQRAVLIDDFVDGGASADPEQHERVLVVLVDVVNRWDRPVTASTSTFTDTLGIEQLPGLAPEGVARFDDATIGPQLQPGVPVQLAVSYLVPDDAFAEGDELRLGLFDLTMHTGESVTYGDYWLDPVLAAMVTLEIEDVGAGADAEETP